MAYTQWQLIGGNTKHYVWKLETERNWSKVNPVSIGGKSCGTMKRDRSDEHRDIPRLQEETWKSNATARRNYSLRATSEKPDIDAIDQRKSPWKCDRNWLEEIPCVTIKQPGNRAQSINRNTNYYDQKPAIEISRSEENHSTHQDKKAWKSRAFDQRN